MTKGFTLVELLVTMGVVAILSAAVVSLIGRGPQQTARDSRRQADLQKIAAALELYRSDNGGYPSGCAGATCLSPQYMGTVPRDPSTNATYNYTPSSCTGTRCAGYFLCADLERTTTQTCAAGTEARVYNP